MTIQYASKASGGWQDVITSKGVNGEVAATVNWQVFDPGASLTYPCRTNTTGQNLGSCSLQGTLSSVVGSVQLPAAKAGTPATIYAFGYTAPSGQRSWGELHSVTKCAGSLASSCSSSQPLGSANNQTTTQYSFYYDPLSTSRVVGIPFNPATSRSVTYLEQRDGTANQALTETTTYSVPPPTSVYVYPVVGTSVVTAPNGSVTQYRTTNMCSGNSRDYCFPILYQVVGPDGAVTELGWSTNTAPPGLPFGLPFNPYVKFRMQSISGKVKSTAALQDVNGNPTSLTEYEWYTPYAPSSTMIGGIYGSPIRTATTSYYTSTPYWTPSWTVGAPRHLRAKQIVQTGTLTSTHTYDDALTTANLTKLEQTDSATSESDSSSWKYTAKGNVYEQTASGVTTQITYDGADLYPAQITVGGLRTATYHYDFESGLRLDETDDNQVKTVYGYDNLGRQTRVEQTVGGVSRVATTSYDDAALSITATRTLKAGQTTSSTTYLDALGRVRYSVDESGMKVQKAYRYGTGGVSYELESNPYGAASDSSTMGWTVTTRDAVGRVTAVQNYPGSTLPGGLSFAGGAPAWGGNTTSSGRVTMAYNVAVAGCAGPGVSVTDEANNTRTSCSDGAGRLIRAIQPDGNAAAYTYDALDKLLTVNFAGQVRRFEYGLGRLRAACNPESVPDGTNGTSAVSCTTSPLPATGVDRYTYYANGNLHTHTNARGVVKTYGYDGLNRLTSKSYSDGTPAVTYQYDQTFKGALYSVSNTAGSTTVYGHDALGRVTSSTQTTAGYTYPAMAYDYNLADQLTSITYPSGRKVTYELDDKGRIISVGGVLVRNGVTVSSAYASALQYAAHGGLTGMSLGSGLGETYSWNDRLQQTGVSTGSLLTLSFAPCVGGGTVCSNNNGNIRQQTITMPGTSATQQYLYDSVNRLVQASENNTSCTAGGSAWCQHFAYDTAGNRRMDQSAGYGISLWEVSAFNPANNRISNANWGYDDTGNIKQNPCGETISYDAENRQVAFNRSTAACGAPAGVSSYVYDGLGQRVARTDVSGRQTVFVYDAFGNLAAEYNPAGAPVDRTQYVTVDHLGSTRLVTGASRTERHDYHPFGFEAIGGWRTAGLGYGASGPVRQQFTGAEHDSESGLNFLQARYLSTPQGRFTSVDPGNAGAMLGDPQSWNGYAYVSNNPLNYTDVSGLGFWSDLFNFLASIFGGGGTGGGRIGVGNIPSIPNIGGVNSGPWNEQWPISGGGFGGGVNTSGVYGSGNTGPFVFSISPDEAILLQTTGGLGRGASIQSPFWSTVGFLFNFLTGTGPRNRHYGPDDYRTQSLMQSKGFQQNMQRIAAACQAGQTSGNVQLGTVQGGLNLPYDTVHSPVGAQVGGYAGGTWRANGNSIAMTIPNEAGARSFLYHRAPNSPFYVGPMRTINQKFDITVPNPCAAH